MLTYIILGLVLFIVGVGATIVYDKAKEIQAARPQRPAPVRKPTTLKGATGTTSSKSINDLLREAQARAAAGQSTVTVQRGNREQTMSVEELIKKLEDMKKKL